MLLCSEVNMIATLLLLMLWVDSQVCNYSYCSYWISQESVSVYNIDVQNCSLLTVFQTWNRIPSEPKKYFALVTCGLSSYQVLWKLDSLSECHEGSWLWGSHFKLHYSGRGSQM